MGLLGVIITDFAFVDGESVIHTLFSLKLDHGSMSEIQDEGAAVHVGGVASGVMEGSSAVDDGASWFEWNGDTFGFISFANESSTTFSSSICVKNIGTICAIAF